MVAAFKKRQGKRLASKLESTTLRGFGGGWNAIDEDLSMPPKYQVTLTNLHRTSSGSQAVRFGQRFVTDIKSVNNSPILDGIYFNARSVLVCANGQVVTINEDASNVTVIWNWTIANALPGHPSGWSTSIPFVCFVPFKDTLIIHNGIDKPIVISSAFAVTYLQDLGSGSNVNVPIGKYGCVAANYHCIAGIPNKPTEVVISSQGTSGVFPGDPEPNDAISIDVGAYAPEGAALIRGIAGFRTYLLVFLQNITLQIKLGEHDDADNHTPKFPDTLPQFGILGNRTIVTVENDLMFCGLSGLASAKRNLYSPDSITSDYLSSIVSPAYRKSVGALTPNQQLDVAFSIFDRLNNDFLLFLTGGRVMVYTFNPRLKMNAWSTYENMDWKCGWTSVLGRMFLAKGTKVFISGNNTFINEDYRADRLLDRDYTYAPAVATFTLGDLVLDPNTNEVWECTVTHPGSGLATFEQERENHPSKWALYQGRAIRLEFELPWIDGKDPAKLKQLRYISVATKGDAEFTFQVFVDNLYKDIKGNILTDYYGNEIKPAVSMVFIGNDAYGYGFDDDPYGGGRRSRDPRLYGMPIKFKTIKFRIVGSVVKKLEFVNLTFLYSRGRFTR
jgi:hypothetical protein